MDAARDDLAGRNERVFESMDRRPGADTGASYQQSILSGMTAAHNQQVDRNWMSERDRRMVGLSAPPAVNPAIGPFGTTDYKGGGNSVGMFSVPPEPINPRSVNGNGGGAPVDQERLAIAKANLAAKQAARGGAGGVDSLPTRNSLNNYATVEKDKRILGNARRYGLDASVPAVSEALGRMEQRARPAKEAAAADAAHNARINQLHDAMMQSHIAHAGTLKPAEAANYLRGVIEQLNNSRAGIPTPQPTKGSTSQVPFNPKRDGSAASFGGTSRMYGFGR